MQFLHSLIFLIIVGIVAGLAGLAGSLVLAFGGSIHYPMQKAFGRVPALAIVTIVNGAILVAWTAFVMLWVERGTPPYNPAVWAAILAALMLVTAPAGMAHRSSMGIASQSGLSVNQYDLLRSLNYVMGIQVAAAIYMYFDRSALHWWRWLPFTG